MGDTGNVIAGAWNVQGGRKVYPLHLATSDVDGIMLALREKRYMIIPVWLLRGMAMLSGVGVITIIVTCVRML